MSASPSERHPTLYFPNGDVVLSASIDASRAQLFRVHKFLLGHHSVTFANMFADADPGSGESYDGVPMVELQGDKAEDLALLLNYLYNPTQMTFRRFDPNTPLVVSGVIRLANKYCIENLREHLVKVVASDWPTTLEDWDFFQTEIQAIKERLETTNRGKEAGEGYQPLSDHLPEPASAIVFAQEFGCHQILRGAYYHLLSIAPYDSWDCPWRMNVAGTLFARWSLLDTHTLLRYIKGLDGLLEYHPSPSQLLSPHCYARTIGDPKAVSRSPCWLFLRGLITSVWSSWTGPKKDPLGLLSQCLEYEAESDENRRGELCDDCRISLPHAIASMRQDLWDNLVDEFCVHELPQ